MPLVHSGSSPTVWKTVGINCSNSHPTKIFNLHSSDGIAPIVYFWLKKFSLSLLKISICLHLYLFICSPSSVPHHPFLFICSPWSIPLISFLFFQSSSYVPLYPFLFNPFIHSFLALPFLLFFLIHSSSSVPPYLFILIRSPFVHCVYLSFLSIPLHLVYNLECPY